MASTRFRVGYAGLFGALMVCASVAAGCLPRNMPTPPLPIFIVPTLTPEPTMTAVPTPLPLDLTAIEAVDWDIYDPDPDHLWNRVLRLFYSRISEDQEYGQDVVDPLLWWDSVYLLDGERHQQAITLLDEFLSTDGAALIRDPLKRAVFQRDLWAVFDWAANAGDYPDQSAALTERLARMIQQVALTDAEINALPDPYALARESGHFYTAFVPDDPTSAFLPDLMNADLWMPLGRESGVMATIHTHSFPSYGRSVFHVLMHVPEEEGDPFAYAEDIRRYTPIADDGLEVALLRRALLINDEGEIVPSPIIESVQIRHFRRPGLQTFYEFVLRRELLFAGVAGGLHPTDGEIPVFMSHGDPFQFGPEFIHEFEIPDTCQSCHESSGIEGTQGIISITRARFPMGGEMPPLAQTTFEEESQRVIIWKQTHPTWQRLLALWGEP